MTQRELFEIWTHHTLTEGYQMMYKSHGKREKPLTYIFRWDMAKKPISKNVSRKVSKDAIETAIIKSGVLAFTGLNNRAMQETAKDKLGEEMNVADQLSQDNNMKV